MTQLTVRFVGAFLLHLDSSNFGRVYLRANSAGSPTKHFPRILFPLKHAKDKFRADDKLALTLGGDRMVRREVPSITGVKFDFGGGGSIFSAATAAPSDTIDRDLSLEYLPPLTSGGSTGLRSHNELLALSSVDFELGNRGRFSSERVVRNLEGAPIVWTFRDEILHAENPAKEQAIADIFSWTIEVIGKNLEIRSSNGVSLLKLVTLDEPSLEVIISNLEDEPIRSVGPRLTEFASLLDYGSGVVTQRVPTKDATVTGGSQTCPGARWP